MDGVTRSTRGTNPERRHRAGSKHRRPSGEPPPLPRHLGRSGRFWIGMIAAIVVAFSFVMFVSPAGEFIERFDDRRLVWISQLRTHWLTNIMLVVNGAGSAYTIRGLRWVAILLLIVFRRWRHLFVFLGSIIVVSLITYQLSIVLARARPLGVTILAGWQGYSMPSLPVAGLSVTLVGIAYAFVPQGRFRAAAKWIIGIAIAFLWFARMYLAVDHPTDAGFGAIIGVAIALVAFRWFAPNEIFPVTYKGGKAAHLDVGGARGQAIEKGVLDQLGLTVLEIKPVGLEGSGGSTPLRLKIEASDDEPERYLFAKLYARNHVRADRWYKIGRSIMYGALEDEYPFQSVRRFVEYEDYTLRLMWDYGIPTPRPYGIVEITPEREYMIVMEFFTGAIEIGDSEIDDGVIEDGLRIVHQLWDAGLAHRDIKPANLMVRDGRLLVIDVFFVQVRPSPWRQAVDLANMMLVLAVRTDAQRVYEHAVRFFTEDEIGEAFAAARGVASPTQLRAVLKKDGRDLLTEFRAMAPARRPVTVQRWSVRRLVLTTEALLGGLFFLLLVVNNWNAFA
jgi:tRNA A-37 threonylcarbamoyl transferase component Bud32/membrane-associated phospholipid phosphatase